MDGQEKVIQSMQAHGFWKSPIRATQGALLGDTILTPVPRVSACLTAYDRLTASCENHRGGDGGMLANGALECLRKFAIQGSWDFHSLVNLIQRL